MLKKIMFVLRFILIGWWFIPLAWCGMLLLTGKISEADDIAHDVFYGAD